MASSTTGSVQESTLESVLGNILRDNWKLTVEQARGMQSSAIQSVLESMCGSVLKNKLGGML